MGGFSTSAVSRELEELEILEQVYRQTITVTHTNMQTDNIYYQSACVVQ